MREAGNASDFCMICICITFSKINEDILNVLIVK
jgi:hypothetical protein